MRATLNRNGSRSEKTTGYMEFYKGSKNGPYWDETDVAPPSQAS
jgi:hypothetical protein